MSNKNLNQNKMDIEFTVYLLCILNMIITNVKKKNTDLPKDNIELELDQS